MDRNSVAWRGVIPALVTPFKADGAIDEGAFRANIERMLAAGCHGILVGGCTGEFWALTTDERKHLVTLAVDAVKRRGTVLAGTGAITTAEAIDLTRHAERAGADGALILPPYFVQPSADDIVEHYRAISAASGIPICLYNIPSVAANALLPALVERLAEVPNVVAIKESSGDWHNFYRTLITVEDRLRVFCGPSSVFGVAATALGAVGHIDCFPNFWTEPMVEMWRAAEAGEMAQARALQAKGRALTDLCIANGRNLYCSTKAAMNALGLPGGFPRLPLRPLDPAQDADLRRGLVRLGFAVEVAQAAQ
ncbi:MAG: dihydrodipicolinate synthase family protein [Alphaproteobacteria bacterium]